MKSVDHKRPLKVFLCHAHADRDPVHGLYTRLTQDGVDAWLDKEKLLPGQDWELEIRKAVREADVVVVCLSKQFNQAGFRQKEVRWALDTAMEQPEEDIFLIPARLEECDTLESLRKWHWVDLFEEGGYERLLKAINNRKGKISRPKNTVKRESFPINKTIIALLSVIAVITASFLSSPLIVQWLSHVPISTAISTPLTIMAPSATLTEVSKRQLVYTVGFTTVESADVFDIPSGNVVGRIKMSDRVLVLEDQLVDGTAWYLCELSSGGAILRGWVKGIDFKTKEYYPLISFDNQIFPMNLQHCWENLSEGYSLLENEGFVRGQKDFFWQFGVSSDLHPISTDFSRCIGGEAIGAVALNALVTRLKPEGEFGFFLQSQNGQKREYTLWINKNEEMYLRVREENNVISDYKVLIVSSFTHNGVSNQYIEFPIQIFLEIDNQGMDNLYLLEGPTHSVVAKDIDPSQMMRIDYAVRPTLGNVQSIGLIGYGGETNVLIWPLVLFGN